MVVDVLRAQPGENLTEVLYTPASEDQEEEHQELVSRRDQAEHDQRQRHTTIKKSDSMFGDRK